MDWVSIGAGQLGIASFPSLAVALNHTPDLKHLQTQNCVVVKSELVFSCPTSPTSHCPKHRAPTARTWQDYFSSMATDSGESLSPASPTPPSFASDALES